MNTLIPARLPGKQSGATLIISMLFLLMLTLIGLSSMGNSKLEQRMAHNYQLNSYVFQGAESAIDDAIITGTQSFSDPNSPEGLRTNTLYDDNTNLFLIAYTQGSSYGTYNADPTNALKAASLAAGSNIVYSGAQMACPGNSFSFTCAVFQVTGTSSISGTGATATHRVSASMLIPGAS